MPTRNQEVETVIQYDDGSALIVNTETGEVVEWPASGPLSMEVLGARFVQAKAEGKAWRDAEKAYEAVIYRLITGEGLERVASPNWGMLKPTLGENVYVPGGEELLAWMRVVEYPRDTDSLMALIASIQQLSSERFEIVCRELGYPFDALARRTPYQYVRHTAARHAAPRVRKRAAGDG